MQRQEAKDVCSPYTCMQGIRKLTSGGYELSSQHHVILQAEPDFDLLELEELLWLGKEGVEAQAGTPYGC